MLTKDINGQGGQQMNSNLDKNNADDRINRKIHLLTQCMMKVYNQIHWMMFAIIVSLGLLYGVTMFCVNLTQSYSLTQQKSSYLSSLYLSQSQQLQQSSTSLYNLYIRSSSLILLLMSEKQDLVLVQTLLLMFLFLILTVVSTVLMNLLLKVKGDYLQCVGNGRQEKYAIELILKRQLKKSQTKGFVQYFESIIEMSIRQKVDQLKGRKEQLKNQLSTQTKNNNNQQMNYLQAIISKLTLIQDVILLPQIQLSHKKQHHSNNSNNYFRKKDENKNTTIKNNNIITTFQYQQPQQQATHLIIVIVSYPQIQQTILDWYERKQNKEKISTQIVKISQTSSPVDYLFQKLTHNNNKRQRQQYKNRSSYSNSFSKTIVLTIAIELLYVGLLAVVIYFHQHPQYIFPNHTIESHSYIIAYSILFIEAIIIFICKVWFNQQFITHNFIKSIPSCVTLSREIQLQSIITISMFLLNVIVVPFVSLFIVQVVGGEQQLNDDNVFFNTLQTVVWGECRFGCLIICYTLLKWIIYQGVKLVIKLIRNRLNQKSHQPNNNNNNIKQSSTSSTTTNISINHSHHLIFEFTILLSISIIINPIIAILPLVGIGFNIKQFLLQRAQVKHYNTCFIVFCQWFINWVRSFVCVLIFIGGVMANSFLVGYGYGRGLLGGFYTVLISVIVSLGLFICVIFLSQRLTNIRCLNNLTLLHAQFPAQQFKSLMDDNRYNQQQSSSINKTTKTKQKEMANLLIRNIYTNQQFLFTFNQQLRKNAFYCQYNKTQTIYQLNKLNSTNKITQELNTMSRSLQQTLKQRLMTNSTNPFQLTQPTKQQYDEQFDQPYEMKVNMRHSKPKTVRIPVLYLPTKQNQNENKQKPLMNRNTQKQGKQLNNIINIKNNTNKQNNLKKRSNINKYKEQDSSDECDILSSIDKQDKNIKINNNNTNNNIKDQLLNKKVKFTDLFDSDQESIKNIVKKKIKKSIPKIIY